MKFNSEVTAYLEDLKHPLMSEIELLRQIVLNANDEITETIKWNAPNFCFRGEDRITMKLFPEKAVQLIFHCGAIVKEPRSRKLITEKSGILKWKTNDRAYATFENSIEIFSAEQSLVAIINKWVLAAH